VLSAEDAAPSQHTIQNCSKEANISASQSSTKINTHPIVVIHTNFHLIISTNLPSDTVFSPAKPDPVSTCRDTRGAEPPVDFLAVCFVLVMMVVYQREMMYVT